MIQFGNKEAASIYIGGKEVQKIEIGGKTAYEKAAPVQIDYFYIENTYAGQNIVTLNTTQSGTPTAGSYATSVQYSKDKSTWTTLTLTAGGTNTISLNQGEKVYFRNDSGYFNYTDDSNNYYTTLTGSSSHKLGGNINTLLDYTDLSNVSLSQGCFNRMFVSDTGLVDASDLELPSTTLTPHCYRALFNSCQSLLYAPTLPATTLAEKCYYAMFFGDYSLISVPSLPATTLANSCCDSMYRGCRGLTSATLNATTLTQYCYANMYRDCSSLNSITIYADDISASNCLNNWLFNVAGSGTFNNLGSATYTPNSASGIPTGWTEDTSNRFVFSNTVITNVGNNQARLTSDVQINYTGSWDDGYFEVYNLLDKDRSVHFSPADITNGVLTASNLITESNVSTLVSPATVTIYDSGTAVWTGSVSFTVVQ